MVWQKKKKIHVVQPSQHPFSALFLNRLFFNATIYSFSILVITRPFLFTASKILCALCIHPPLPQFLATTDLFTVSMVVPFPECPIVGIKQYVPFSDGLRSLTNIHLSFLHVFFWLDSSLLSRIESSSIVGIYQSLSIHLLKDSLVASKFWQVWIKQL